MTTIRSAAATYAANVAETRAHFAAQEEALREEWLATDMDIIRFDARLAALRALEAKYLAEEKEVYYLNLAAQEAQEVAPVAAVVEVAEIVAEFEQAPTLQIIRIGETLPTMGEVEIHDTAGKWVASVCRHPRIPGAWLACVPMVAHQSSGMRRFMTRKGAAAFVARNVQLGEARA